jgi:uncharacterized protein (DUF1697 family)
LHIALLRSVNLGGRNLVAMSGLKGLLSDLGFLHVRSLLQSGNLVFESRGKTGDELERLLERTTEERLKIRTAYFVRTAKEWNDIVVGNPFPAGAKDDPGHLVVSLLKRAPRTNDLDALQAAISGPERVRGGSRHVYITYPAGIGRSKLTTALIEKTLGSSATARNWNTVLKLHASVQGVP